MWYMLCKNAADLEVKSIDFAANDDIGVAHWEATYSFSDTGRRVHINPLVFRLCEEEYVLAAGTPRETRIPDKSVVFACTASAGFDANEIPDPETFSTDRPNYHYMHFGYGHHTCLGKYVELMQIPETVKQVLLRPGVQLLPGNEGKIDFQGTAFPERFVIAYDS